MRITKVLLNRIPLAPGSGPTRAIAYANIVIEDCFIIRGLRVIEAGEEGERTRHVAMPSRPNRLGLYKDIAHPLTQACREAIEAAVLAELGRA